MNLIYKQIDNDTMSVGYEQRVVINGNANFPPKFIELGRGRNGQEAMKDYLKRQAAKKGSDESG